MLKIPHDICKISVDLKFPKVEVRFQNLKVESYVHVGSRALPTIPNFLFNMAEVIGLASSYFQLFHLVFVFW